jgi:hypothetical protein
MSTDCSSIRVGQAVPDFKMETYELAKDDFGDMSPSALKAAKNGLFSFSGPLILLSYVQPSLPRKQKNVFETQGKYTSGCKPRRGMFSSVEKRRRQDLESFC